MIVTPGSLWTSPLICYRPQMAICPIGAQRRQGEREWALFDLGPRSARERVGETMWEDNWWRGWSGPIQDFTQNLKCWLCSEPDLVPLLVTRGSVKCCGVTYYEGLRQALPECPEHFRNSPRSLWLGPGLEKVGFWSRLVGSCD